MDIARLAELEAFTTLDGSTIRELAGPTWTAAENQSLAQATVPPGGRTEAHYHRTTEELYLFTAGRGLLRLGGEEAEVGAGDCVVIPPGSSTSCGTRARRSHSCCCAPAYSDEDTVLAARR